MPTDRPNVLFLLSDQHSFRFASHRDDVDSPVQTPTVDSLAESGTTFQNAYCPVPLCTPSRMCLLSGREAQRCGAWENWLELDPRLPTLPGTLSDAGYETALVGKMHLGGTHQFAGFDRRPYGDLTGRTGHQSDPPEPYWQKDSPSINYGRGVTGIPESLLQERNVVEETLSFVREQSAAGDEPWFCCASFSRPHPPLTTPQRQVDRYPPEDVPEPNYFPEERGPDEHPAVPAVNDHDEMRNQRAGYCANVDYLDETMGDLIALLERGGHLENTIVIYTSDHGDMAGEHARDNKCYWYEDSAHVPMIVQTPAQRTGAAPAHSIESPVGLIDFFPTLCGLLGVEEPDGLDGHDLSSAVEAGDEPDRRPVVSDYLTISFGYPTYRMVTDGEYKLVRFPEYDDLLYDLTADPMETENVIDSIGDDEIAHLQERANGVDFDVAEAVRKRDEEELPEKELPVAGAKSFLNAYHLPDGRVVDAETPLYQPQVIAEAPERVFGDCPD